MPSFRTSDKMLLMTLLGTISHSQRMISSGRFCRTHSFGANPGVVHRALFDGGKGSVSVVQSAVTPNFSQTKSAVCVLCFVLIMVMKSLILLLLTMAQQMTADLSPSPTQSAIRIESQISATRIDHDRAFRGLRIRENMLAKWLR